MGSSMTTICAESVDEKSSERDMNVGLPLHQGLQIIAPLLARLESTLEGNHRGVVFLEYHGADQAVATASANPQNEIFQGVESGGEKGRWKMNDAGWGLVIVLGMCFVAAAVN